jgi:mRNA interferase MazF
MALTTQPQRAGYPLTYELHSPKLPKRSWVKVSQIRTLAVERIGAKLGRISPEDLGQVIEGLNEIIGA